jgi:hypothetical protein
LIAAPAGAAVITISDLTDGNPVVTISTDLLNVQTALTPEQAIITGLLPAGITVVPGTRSVILVEPASDPFGPPQSDFLTLTVGAAAPTFTILFESDGATNFTRDVAALPPGTPTLLEDGTLQNVSSLLNSGAFSISIQSDLATPEIPEPYTPFLLLSGLLLICVGRLRSSRSPMNAATGL